MVLLIMNLYPYLEVSRITRRADSSPPRWVINLADSRVNPYRWRLRLVEYNYGIQNPSNINNETLDTISRLHTDGREYEEIDEGIPTL